VHLEVAKGILYLFYKNSLFFIVLALLCGLFTIGVNGGGTKSCRLRAISYQGTPKVEAGYTTETLIGYTACCAQFILFIHSYG
jgi:hypothetical protein